jgi:ribosomal protein S18 acetylase RimI-like enzyme
VHVGRICYPIGVEISTSVRSAQLSDTVALTDLVNRAYAIEAFFVEGPRTTSDEIAALIGSGAFLVLDGTGGIAAAVLYRGPGERDGVPPAIGSSGSSGSGSSAYFGMLSVLPELQGRGLGRRLVQVVEAMAEATGATSMRLRVINLREELTRWYTSLGYREVGTTPYTHRSVKLPCHFIEMVKQLAPAGPRHAGEELGTA